MEEKKEGGNLSHTLSEEELQEIYDTKMTMALVFKGRISKLSKIVECLDKNDCYLVFRKVSKGKLIISAEKSGDNNDNSA